jgi:DNA-binding transcriptional LysR family regulator
MINKLQAMEVFVQVVDTGSFTRAAEILQLPKATVSTLVQSLEGSLSAKLLHRTTRLVTVTTDGAAFYERCLRILSDVRDAEESLSRTRLSPSGRLRVDVSTGLASEVLIPALPAFFERYPDIMLELGSTDRPVDLVEEGVDCAIRGGELWDTNLIARRVGIINFLTGTEGARVTVLLHRGPDEWRCSLRTLTEGVDVSAIASRYGGGGHPKAAGCRIAGGEAERDAFLREVDALAAAQVSRQSSVVSRQ